MSDSKVREQFEAWTIRAGGHPSVLRRNGSGDYALNSVRAEYAAWQASRAAALEEAAEALRLLRPNSEGYKRSEWDKFDWEQPCADAIDRAFDIGTDTIRALAAKGGA